jgi:predicted dienelactone hydrolase
MRPFEILLVCLLLSGTLWSFLQGNRSKKFLSFYCAFTILALAIHVFFEGPHWQMAPAYIAVLLFAFFLLRKSKTQKRRTTVLGAMFSLTLLSCILSAILPMFRLPVPTGKYPVGTCVIHMVDRRRIEGGEEYGHLYRELMVQVWYPAEPSNRPVAPYRKWKETTLLSSYQAVLPTHSRVDAPIARGGSPYPVLLFNPAWNGRRTQNTYLTEDLASHGFVVVGVDHTGNSGPTAFPNGRVALPIPAEFDDPSLTLEQIDSVIDNEVQTQAADDRFVLDEMGGLNLDAKSRFYKSLDTNHAGALGHSVGGSVAALACYQDPRIRAALTMSGPFFGGIEHIGLNKPLMTIFENLHRYSQAEIAAMPRARRMDVQGDTDGLNQLQASLEKYGGYQVVIDGINHASVTDKILFSPIPSLSGAGSAPSPKEIESIIRQYALAFFGSTLRNQSSPLLETTNSPFRYVTFTKYVPHSLKN